MIKTVVPKELHFVFTAPPSHNSEFVELEDENGNGVGLGRWEHHPPFWHLVLDTANLAVPVIVQDKEQQRG